MFQHFRYSYNATVGIAEKLKITNPSLFKNKSLSYYKLRDEIIKFKYTETETEKDFILRDKNEKRGFPLKPRMTDVHNRIPRGAIKSFVGNYNSAVSNRGKNNFHMKPKKKTELTKECLFEDKKYPSWIKDIKGHYKQGRKKILWKDIQKTHKKGMIVYFDRRSNKYFLFIPVDVIASPKKNIEKQDIISLDTGVRTFQTGYSAKGDVIEIGKNDCDRIYSLLLKTDSYAKKFKKTGVKKWKKKYFLVFYRIKNLIDDLHWKSINFLTKTFKTIIIPDFRISGMVKGNVLARKTKRLLYMFSYNKFKTRLLWKAKLAGVKIHVVDESYTSKTCGRCGWQHDNLKGNKIFSCKECSLVIDRDYNGARNILLKHLK